MVICIQGKTIVLSLALYYKKYILFVLSFRKKMSIMKRDYIQVSNLIYEVPQNIVRIKK